MMKTIKRDQVSAITAGDVKPGMIIVEGIILEVERQPNRGTRDIIWMRTPSASVWSYDNKDVQVFAKVGDEMVRAIADTYAKEMRP